MFVAIQDRHYIGTFKSIAEAKEATGDEGGKFAWKHIATVADAAKTVDIFIGTVRQTVLNYTTLYIIHD